jgi:hypothetical protein
MSYVTPFIVDLAVSALLNWLFLPGAEPVVTTVQASPVPVEDMRNAVEGARNTCDKICAIIRQNLANYSPEVAIGVGIRPGICNWIYASELPYISDIVQELGEPNKYTEYRGPFTSRGMARMSPETFRTYMILGHDCTAVFKDRIVDVTLSKKSIMTQDGPWIRYWQSLDIPYAQTSLTAVSDRIHTFVGFNVDLLPGAVHKTPVLSAVVTHKIGPRSALGVFAVALPHNGIQHIGIMFTVQF